METVLLETVLDIVRYTSDIVDSLGRDDTLLVSNSQESGDAPVSFPTPVDNRRLLDMKRQNYRCIQPSPC